MTFRDESEALRERADALERELAEVRRENDTLRAERDAARAGKQPPGDRHEAGDAVWVEWQGRWWRGTVLRVEGERLWHVHYDGWSKQWDETVGPRRIARGDGPPPGERARPLPIGLLAAGAIAVVLAIALGLFFGS